MAVISDLFAADPAVRVQGFGHPVPVRPTVLRVRGFRFYFFSREERRPHVHVQHAEGEAKFWIDPTVNFMRTTGSSRND